MRQHAGGCTVEYCIGNGSTVKLWANGHLIPFIKRGIEIATKWLLAALARSSAPDERP
jgi:hypothetical protein